MLAGGALVILLLTAAAALMLWRGRQESLDTWRLYLGNFAATAAEHAAQTIRTVDFVLSRAVDRIEREQLDGERPPSETLGTRAVHDMLRERVAEVAVIDGIALVTPQGQPVNGSRTFPPPELNLADRDYVQAHVADPSLELFVSAPARNRVSGRWTFYVSRKLRAPSGGMVALAVAGIELGYFERFYRSISLSESDSAILLLRRDGTLLVRYPERAEALGRSYRAAPLMQALSEALAQGRSGATVHTSAPRVINASDTQPRLAAAHAVSDFPLAVSITATEDFMLRGWTRMARAVGAGVLATDLLIAGLALWIHRLLRRRRLALQQLEAARKAAEAASRVKSQFLANMSHEIRTPLHGMLGMAQQLLEEPLPPPQRQRAEVIQRSGELLLGVIDDVLDFSRIEAGRLELERVPFELVQLARDSVALFQTQARAKGLALRLALEDGTAQARLLGDPLRLSQILNNLLANAVKFTPSGSVALQLTPLGGGRWRVAVRDTGIGLSEAECRRIFEPFMQADSSTTRRFGGSGLGLAIVRSLLRLHGSELGVDSAPGKGSTFWFVLELPPAPAAPAPAPVPSAKPAPAPAASLAGRRVLVAEDNEVNMELACAVLRALGVEVRQAADGAQAVQAYAAARPDLVLMDMHMPEVDGLAATRQIRAQEAARGWPRRPIVALTASALPEDRQRCLDAGMDDVLVKPFGLGQLRRMLEQHCR
ncbi:hybrid sensor histidine kinase/response regulator [Azohydromonas caseinilytica]|uniref:Sensory/regulatory protein RpfC n=1 Tax=Azohydromonas caseinilytica TaxID=2728836 RepID=A0A848FES5_9BURK|nr:hybrid sensor histidine kinase/response regulator [Azohydromonas caseinilytica]NML16650.1 response regulator [Azohydromonas caseinilytica]